MRVIIRLVALIVLYGSLSSVAYANTASTIKNAAVIEINEEELLIAEVRIGKLISEYDIEIYHYDGGFMVPLGQLFQLLEIAIDVNGTGNRLEGWYLAEDRRFLLDTDKKELIINGKRHNYPSQIIPYQGRIYVDAVLLKEWFNLNLSFDFATLIIQVKSKEKLPYERRQEREKFKSRSWKPQEEGAQYDVIETPYQLFSSPFASLTFGSTLSVTDGESDVRDSYSLITGHDVLFMGFESYVAGSVEEGVSNVRLKAGRQDRNNGLLGGLKASSFYVGDVDSIAVPLVESSSQGRGVTFSNASLTRAEAFDSTSFRGDTQPGWDVELYRNGTLIDFQTIGDDGRYAFEDVLLFYGNNTFRLEFYGPQGEQRTQVESYTIDSSILKEGEFIYDASVNEKAQTLLGVSENDTTLTHPKDVRAVLSTSYGLTNTTTVKAGVVRTPIEGGVHNYVTSGFSRRFGSWLLDNNTAFDTDDGGWVTEFTANTRIKEVNIRAEQLFYSEFMSATEIGSSDTLESSSLLRFDGTVPIIGLTSNMSYQLSAEYDRFESGRDRVQLSNNLGAFWGGAFWGNRYQWISTSDIGGGTTEEDIGSFSVRGRVQNHQLRATLGYTTIPQTEFDTLILTWSRQVKDDYSLQFDLTKSFIGDRVANGRFTLSKDFKRYRITGQLGATSDSDIVIGTNISMSIGDIANKTGLDATAEQLSNSAMVLARGFVDENTNGKYDEGEQLSDINFLKAKEIEHFSTEEGRFLYSRTPYLPDELVVDPASIEELSWRPAKDGYSVVSRPGVITKIDVPLVVVGEIEGMVYVQHGDVMRGASGVTVRLLNAKEEVVATTKTEFDGFYIFEDISHDQYILEVDPKEASRFSELALPLPKHLDFNKSLDYMTDQDLLIEVE